jgi:septal ring-binding cell division protein DamX
MVALLNSFREMLEDLGDGLGVTDPISGEAVVQLGTRAKARSATKARPKKAKPAAKPAKKPAAKKRAAAKKSAKRRGR